MAKYDFLLAGVGGQGTILAGDILAEVGLAAGFDAKKSEVHGMSQRGGIVESHVRWGDEVFSPLAERGAVDYILGFESLEAGRWAHYLAKNGKAIINRYQIPPLSVSSRKEQYPTEEEIVGLFAPRQGQIKWVDAIGVAKKLGNPALAGVVLLGALSRELNVDQAVWLKAIEELVPAKFRELNKEAFLAGRTL